MTTEESYLRNVSLPAQTKSYTVISHGSIIDHVRNELAANNFEILEERYSYGAHGKVAQGRVYIRTDKDPDMGMMFTWWNSYNKQVRFGCAIGSFIYDNKASLVGSEGMSWLRKHTGTADTEVNNVMSQLIEHANEYFDKIITEKERMKAMPLSTEDYGCVMGALYFEHDLLTPNQASAVNHEYKKPVNEYQDKNTLWWLYKLIMFGIDDASPNKWMKTQQKLHHLIMTEYAIAKAPAPIPIAQPMVEVSAGPDKTTMVCDICQEVECECTQAEIDKGDIIEDDVKLPYVGTIFTEPVAEINAEDVLTAVKEDLDDQPLPLTDALKDLPTKEVEDFNWNLNSDNVEMIDPLALPDGIITDLSGNPVTEETDLSELDGVACTTTMPAEEVVEKYGDGILGLDGVVIEETGPVDLLTPEVAKEKSESLPEPTPEPEAKEAIDFLDISEHEGIRAASELISQSGVIEKQMSLLYGSVRPYQISKSGDYNVVTIEDTLESFYVEKPEE